MNQAETQLRQIFKKGSKTYFNSSLFFPKEVRWNVIRLYGFVRTADNFVDAVPQNKQGFQDFCKVYETVLKTNKPSGNIIIDEFTVLSKEKQFDPEWTRAFLYSMELDLKKKVYSTLPETLEYIYGSAEVIGLYMAKLLELPQEAYPAARMLGRSMQYINFIRDIAEDNELGRTYLPLAASGLKDLKEETARKNPEAFIKFIKLELERYRCWQKEAEEGFRFIPYRPLIAVKTASDMYNWTAEQIKRNPFIVYQKKIKPSKLRILMTMAGNCFL